MSDIYLLLVVVILGVVEGLIEFLFVFSIGYMIIVGYLLGFEGDIVNIFEVVIQLGLIFVVVVMFWCCLFGLIGIYFGKLLVYEGQGSGCLLFIYIFFGMIFVVVMGLIFYDIIKFLFNLVNVMYVLIVGGVLLIVVEVLKLKQLCVVGIDDMIYCQVFVIGCFQCLVLWSGFFCLGVIIFGGMLMGVSCYVVLEFFFLLVVLMMMGVIVLDVYKSIGFLNMGDVLMFVVGFVMVFIVVLIVIKIFLQLIKWILFILFVIYCFIVVVVVYVVFF